MGTPSTWRIQNRNIYRKIRQIAGMGYKRKWFFFLLKCGLFDSLKGHRHFFDSWRHRWRQAGLAGMVKYIMPIYKNKWINKKIENKIKKGEKKLNQQVVDQPVHWRQYHWILTHHQASSNFCLMPEHKVLKKLLNYLHRLTPVMCSCPTLLINV